MGLMVGSVARSLLVAGLAIIVMATSAQAGIVHPEAFLPFHVPDDLPPPKPCGASGAVRALLIGIQKYHPPLSPLAGSVQDVEMLGAALEALRVPRANVRILRDGDATRQAILAALSKVVGESNCGDFVLIHFSGSSSPAQWRFSEIPDVALHSFDSPGGSQLPAAGVGGRDLSAVMTALRNRGVFVFLSVDGCAAAGLNLQDQFGARLWRFAPGEAPSPLKRSAGGIALFFATGESSLAYEAETPKGKMGRFSFALSSALLSPDVKTIRQLAERTQQLENTFTQDPQYSVFEASEPDLDLLAPLGAGVQRGKPSIELTQPRLARGVARIESSKLLLEGRVSPAKDLQFVLVNGRPVTRPSFDSFRDELEVAEGRTTILVQAFYSSGSFAQQIFDVDRDAVALAAVTGHRFALIVGNASYTDPEWPRLITPVEDAKAVADVLKRRFGFELSVDSGGQQTSLVVKDGSRNQILDPLEDLSDRLRPEDTLLVYFAGHGQRDEAADQTYWVPIDGRGHRISTFISSAQLLEEIKRMNAMHVLIVSDSCFGGNLLRGGATKAKSKASSTAAERDRYLAELLRRKSRALLSSGADEPVPDQGGQGHSLFARAFLNVLESAKAPFTASELWEDIRGEIAADGKQSPQYHSIPGAHAGGEFVFVPK